MIVNKIGFCWFPRGYGKGLSLIYHPLLQKSCQHYVKLSVIYVSVILQSIFIVINNLFFVKNCNVRKIKIDDLMIIMNSDINVPVILRIYYDIYYIHICIIRFYIFLSFIKFYFFVTRRRCNRVVILKFIITSSRNHR